MAQKLLAHTAFCADDGRFGPVSTCRAFDFTLRFEDSILSILPNAIFEVVAFGLIVFTLLSRRRRIQLPTERSACVQHRDGGAIALALLHSALMVTLVVLADRCFPSITTATAQDMLVMPALVLETLSALIIVAVLVFQRSAAATPIVTLINTFLLFSSLFAAVQLRTWYFIPAARLSAFLPVFAADFGTRWLLFLTTSTKPYKPRSTAQERASFISSIFFFYLLPSLWKGTKKPIELQDVEPLPASYASRTLEEKLYREWHGYARKKSFPRADTQNDSFPSDSKSHHDVESVAMSDLDLMGTARNIPNGFGSDPTRPISFLPKHPAANPQLVNASVRAFGGVLFSPLPAKALYTVLVLLQPLLVQETLDFIASYSDASREPKPAAYGYGIVGAFFLVYLLIALSQGHFTFSIYKTTCKLRGALVQAVYDKCLVLSVDALQDSENPSPTVMQSVDIERIVGGLDPFHEIWSGVVIIVVALYLMWQQIGLAFVATIITLACLFVSIPLMTKNAKGNQEKWSRLTDERTTLTSAVINAIKAVKQSALENFLIDKIVSIRQREIKALISYVQDLLSISFLGTTAGDILLLATITTFALVLAFHQSTGTFTFDTATIFTTITIVKLIERPLFIIGRRYASLVAAITSLKRLQTFLLLPEQVPGERDATWSPSAEKIPLVTSSAAVFDGASMSWKNEIAPSSSDGSRTTDTSHGDSGADDTAPSDTEDRAKHDSGLVLRELSLVLPRDQLTVVVGEVGTGKTSLLCSLLGELSVLQGEVMLPVRSAPIAYVSQEPWTQGERSIKENVVFYKEFDEERYQRALLACGLVVDVQQLSKGDDTLAKHLSGGQKQRVALCRAVYADAPTYVLDDVLSAVDAATAASINQALFSRQHGLLRGKTVVMATNSVQQMQLADQIVQMNTGGTARMMSGEADTVSKLADKIENIRRKSMEEKDEDGMGGESSITAEIRATAAKERKTLEMEEEQEEVLTERMKLSLFKRYFAAAGWWASLSYPLALVVQTGFANGELLWIQAWAKHVSQATLRGSIGIHVGILALLAFARLATYIVSLAIYVRLFTPRISLKLHSDEIAGLLRSGAEFFLNLNPGRIINRFTQDIFALDFQICVYVVNVYYYIIEMGFSLVLMVLPAPYLLGVIAAMAAFYFGIYKLYSPSSRQLRRLEMATKSPLHSQFKDTADLQGLLTIRALHMQPYFSNATSSLLDTSQRPYFSLWTVRVWLQTWLNLLAMVLNTALVLLAVSLRHKSNAGLLGVALVQAVSISLLLNGLMSSWTELEIGTVALERIEQIITIPADPNDDASQLREMPSAAPAHTDGPNSSAVKAVAVRFEDVTVGYGNAEGPKSLRKVNFSLRAGERLGVCGRSGSGKSTMLLSLLRILTPSSGRILLDGVDAATLTGTSVRRNISYIPQEPMMLPSLSVRENLDPEGEHSDDEAYWNILRQTSMSDAISQLPEGLDNPIDLQALSMGQKQLLNVARALLKRRGLLVMDEATSNLDGDTDAQIQHALAAGQLGKAQSEANSATRAESKKPLKATSDGDDFVAMPGRPTTITIAHRLATIMDYDKILVLGNGEVLEFGSPSELLQLEDGEFKSMVEEQTRNMS